MQICLQCNGKPAIIGQTDIQDGYGNTEAFHVASGMKPAAQVCSQCQGKGFINSFGGAGY